MSLHPKASIGYAAVREDGHLTLHQLTKPAGEYQHEVVIMLLEDYDALIRAMNRPVNPPPVADHVHVS